MSRKLSVAVLLARWPFTNSCKHPSMELVYLRFQHVRCQVMSYSVWLLQLLQAGAAVWSELFREDQNPERGGEGSEDEERGSPGRGLSGSPSPPTVLGETGQV